MGTCDGWNPYSEEEILRGERTHRDKTSICMSLLLIYLHSYCFFWNMRMSWIGKCAGNIRIIRNFTIPSGHATGIQSYWSQYLRSLWYQTQDPRTGQQNCDIHSYILLWNCVVFYLLRKINRVCVVNTRYQLPWHHQWEGLEILNLTHKMYEFFSDRGMAAYLTPITEWVLSSIQAGEKNSGTWLGKQWDVESYVRWLTFPNTATWYAGSVRSGWENQ